MSLLSKLKDFFKKPSKEEIDSFELSNQLNIEDSVDEPDNSEDYIEYDPEAEKDIQILEFFQRLKKEKKISHALIHMKSRKDVNVVIVVPDDKVTETIVNIEVQMHVDPSLNVQNTNRIKNKLKILTKTEDTFEVRIITNSEFEEHYSKQK